MNLLRSISFIGLILLFFITPLAFCPWVTTFTMTKETVAELILLAIVIPWAIWILSTNQGRSLRSPLTIPISIFFTTILISIVNTESFYDSTLGLALFGSYGLTYFIAISVVKRKWIKPLLGVVLLASFLAGVYLILQFYQVDFPFWATMGFRRRLFSTFGNPNYVAGYLIACLPVAFVLFLSTKKRWLKFGIGVLVVISYTVILMTYTRASWAGLLIASIFTFGLVYLFLGGKTFRKNSQWLVGLAMVLLAVTVIYSTQNPLNWEGRSVAGRAASSFDLKQGSLQKRFLMWHSAIQMAKWHPIIGLGIGTFGLNYPQAQAEVLAKEANLHFVPQASKTINAHNDPLHLLAEIGILGLLCAVWIIITFFRKGLLSLRKVGPGDKFLLIGLMGGGLAILAHSIFSFPFHIIPNGLLFWLLLALSWVSIRQSGVKREESSVEGHESRVQDLNPKTQDPRLRTQDSRLRTRRALQWIVSIVVVIAVIFLGTLRVRLFQADMYLQRGKLLAQVGRFSEASGELEAAAAIAPQNGRIYGILGETKLKMKRFPQAIEAFKKAERNWIYQTLYIKLAEAYRENGNLKEARNALLTNIKLFPNQADSYSELATIYLNRSEEYLNQLKPTLAEAWLDRAVFLYEQVKIFRPEPSLYGRIAKDLYQLGLKAVEGKKQAPTEDKNHRFFSHKYPIIDILAPQARPGKPVYFKVFYYAPDTKKPAKGSLEIKDPERKILKEVELVGDKHILSGRLPDGLPPGVYQIISQVKYKEGKQARLESEFAVIEKGKALGEIRDFSIIQRKAKEPTVVQFTFKNNFSRSFQIQGVVKIRDVMREKEAGIVRIDPITVPAGEKKITVSWNKKLDPGLYTASAQIIYAGNLITTASERILIAK